MSEPRYEVLTWDTDEQDFTPQDGVPSVVVGFAGLRSALRELRNMGYAADRTDPSVLVERIEE